MDNPTGESFNNEMRSYGSEDEFVKGLDEGQHHVNGEVNVPTGDQSRATWDFVFKLAQVAILPLLASMIYLMGQISDVKQAQSVMQERITQQMNALPRMDTMIGKMAVFEDRQIFVLRKLEIMETDIRQHREKEPRK